MKIVLRDDVENLGRKGDVVDVADGYARNYLVPRGLAMSQRCVRAAYYELPFKDLHARPLLPTSLPTRSFGLEIESFVPVVPAAGWRSTHVPIGSRQAC